MKRRTYKVLSMAICVAVLGSLLVFAAPPQPASAQFPSGGGLEELFQGLKELGKLLEKLAELLKEQESVAVPLIGAPPGMIISRFQGIGYTKEGLPAGEFEGAYPAPTDGKPMQIFMPRLRATSIYSWTEQEGYKLIDIVVPVTVNHKIVIDYSWPLATAQWQVKAFQAYAETHVTTEELEKMIYDIQGRLEAGGTVTFLSPEAQARLAEAPATGLDVAVLQLADSAAGLEQAAADLKAQLRAQVKEAALEKLQDLDAEQVSSTASTLDAVASQLNETTSLFKGEDVSAGN